MAQHELDFEEGGATNLEVGAERMAQGVRVKIVKTDTGEDFVETVTKVVGFGNFGEGQPNIICDLIVFDVSLEFAIGFVGEANFALFLAFANTSDVGAIKILETEVGDFANSEASIEKEAHKEPLGKIFGVVQNVFDFGGRIRETTRRSFAKFLDQN